MYATDYDFDYPQVESDVVDQVREALGQGRGAAVVGPAGVGKSHSVARAVNGAIWVSVPDAPFAVPRVLADLAEQAGDRAEVLQAFDRDGCAAACTALDRILEDRVVVLDRVDRLARFESLDPFEDRDASALWFSEADTLRRWAVERVERSHTLLIARWLPEPPFRVAKPPTGWVVKLKRSARGYVPWNDVARRLATNPGAMFLAAATLRLAGPHQLNAWLRESAELDTRDARSALAERFVEVSPTALQRLLAVVDTAGEVETRVLDELADGDDELDFALELARELRLLEERGGRTRLAGYLPSAGAVRPLSAAGGNSLARQVVASLLGRVNDRSSLEGCSARRVLDVHRLQLATGDLAGALTTARLHLGGLVSRARSLSIRAQSDEEFDQARRLYGQIRHLLGEHPSTARPHVRSYVDHYHGYNGYRARTLGLSDVALDYDRAIDGWPANAMWHARRIALAAERGDAERALSLQREAYTVVPEHERRDAYLRIRAASWASAAGADEIGMQLLGGHEPARELPLIDAVAAQALRRLSRRWAQGVPLDRLTDGAGVEVVFNSPLKVRVERTNDGWRASVELLRAKGHGDSAWWALKSLAQRLAEECRTLIRTPSGRLDVTDVSYKGLYLGLIDLVNSQMGLPFNTHRWLLGTLSDGRFVPRQSDVPPLSLADHIDPATQGGYFLARVHVDHAGFPDGPIERLVEAGAGNRLGDLLFVLRRLAEDDGEAA